MSITIHRYSYMRLYIVKLLMKIWFYSINHDTSGASTFLVIWTMHCIIYSFHKLFTIIIYTKAGLCPVIREWYKSWIAKQYLVLHKLDQTIWLKVHHIRRLMETLPSSAIKVKISLDGAKYSRTSNFCILSFTVLGGDEFSQSSTYT